MNVLNIFLSYGRADSRELAIRLRDDLQAVGYSVWLDLEEIAGGASWSQNIEDAIEHCHVTIALMSPASYESQWCRAEQLRAIRKGKRIIPLLSVAGAEVPLHLEHMNYLDFTSPSRYDEKFRDLLSDMRAASAFFMGTEQAVAKSSPFKKTKITARNVSSDEKRSAPSFRRYLRQLRSEAWLGARFWWPYFLFHFTDLEHFVQILQAGELRSPYLRGQRSDKRWDKFVRLYFRPRTPDVFHGEGVRRQAVQPVQGYAPIPIYLLFDLEAMICHPDACFSNGDPAKNGKTYKTPQSFRELPFEQIYHDSWFMPDEREEIMNSREAQVLIRDKVALESLELIWLRSAAEYETLKQLMPSELWEKWHNKITVRPDYHLFNNKRPYVESAHLQADAIRLRFNRCQDSDCGPFKARLEVLFKDGEKLQWQDDAFQPDRDLVLALPNPVTDYEVVFYLEGAIAYQGIALPKQVLF